GVCFSSEKAAEVSKEEHGIDRVIDLVAMDVPDVYSAALSEYVLTAGLALFERERPDVMYLSLTDYIQHKHAPGDPVATAFYAMLDPSSTPSAGAAAAPGIPADHGMKAKSRAVGRPTLVYRAPLSSRWSGRGRAGGSLPFPIPSASHPGRPGR